MSASNESLDRLPSGLQEGRPNRPATSQSQVNAGPKPILVRELAAVVLLVILCDVTIYRSHGFAGPSLLFLVAPLLLGLGCQRFQLDVSIWFLIPMLVLVSARLIWCGSGLAIAVGIVLVFCFAMSLFGIRPYLTMVIQFVWHLIGEGYRGLRRYESSLGRFSPRTWKRHWLAVVLPAAALVTFATIFVMANPDLVTSLESHFSALFESLEKWVRHIQLLEIPFCFAMLWLAVGALRPDRHRFDASDSPIFFPEESAKSPLYEAFRNTMAVVVGLFAADLVFEFWTLWFRTFPKGFHYSGYAHEGAAWLTVALGLATLSLSLIFRGTILGDPRLGRLRVLSWIWSIENLLLAVSVFNRLFIYIGFNGMTRMRVIGILGVASVVGGLLLVIRKIARNHDFVWLIRRQLWTVAFAVYLYAVLPVDAIVNQYNVDRILAGDPTPCVQISVHPTSDEGFLCLEPLINCNDVLIRDGIRTLLDEKLTELEAESNWAASGHWTATQVAHRQLLDRLQQAK